MYCENCGAKNDDNARFCCECGSPLVNEAEEKKTQTEKTLPKSNGTENVKNITNKAGKFPKKVLIGIVAAVIVIIAVGIFINKSSKTIDLNKYVTVEVNGYDGYGLANLKIDWDAIEKKYKSKISFKSPGAAKKLKGLYGDTSPMTFLENNVQVQRDDDGDYVSNGDKIAYTWAVSSDISNYLNCKLKYKDGEEKVSGLEKTKQIDVFNDVEVKFEGRAPEGTAYIVYHGKELDESYFTLDPSSGLNNGDKVKVTLNDSGVNSLSIDHGEVPKETEKEYTVSGLESTLEKLADIDKDSLKSMQQQAEDVYNAYMAQNWENSSSLQSFTYLGEYLLTRKDGNDDYWDNNNMLYLVYKVQIRSQYADEYGSYDAVDDIYWYISYSNLMLNGDGAVDVDLLSYNTPGDGVSIDNGTWYYSGYDSLDSLYKNVVTAKLDTYKHEDNVDANAAIQKASEDKKADEAKNDSDKKDSDDAAASTPAADNSAETEAAGEADQASADSSASADSTATGDASEFVLPNSSTEHISITDVEGLSQQQCLIARNEIYARHGRKFKDQGIQDYFNGCSWYNGTIEADDFQESYLSDLERENEEVIVAYEEEMGYR